MAGSEPAFSINDWVFSDEFSTSVGARLVCISNDNPNSFVGIRLNGVLVPLLVKPSEVPSGTIGECWCDSQYVMATNEWLEEFGEEDWQYGQVYDAIVRDDNAFTFEAFGDTVIWDTEMMPIWGDVDLEILQIGVE